MLGTLRELQLVLAWVLLSLTNCDRVGKKKKLPRLVPLPFHELLTWLYAAARHCYHLVEDKVNMQYDIIHSHVVYVLVITPLLVILYICVTHEST